MPRPVANPAVPIEVLHRADSFVVLAKPAGIVTEPGLGHRDDSLLNGAFAHWGAELARMGDERDWGLLHRLDRDTSGAVLVALDPAAYDDLRAQFEARTVRKRYLAIVEGRPPRPQGTVDVPLEEARRGDMKVSLARRGGGGKPAVTRWRLLAGGKARALLDVDLETGRLHQIRAHLAEIGCPVVGDRVYRVDLPPNTSRPPPGRPPAPMALHAHVLGFRAPGSRDEVTVTVPVPDAFARIAAESGITLPAAATHR